MRSKWEKKGRDIPNVKCPRLDVEMESCHYKKPPTCTKGFLAEFSKESKGFCHSSVCPFSMRNVHRLMFSYFTILASLTYLWPAFDWLKLYWGPLLIDLIHLGHMNNQPHPSPLKWIRAVVTWIHDSSIYTIGLNNVYKNGYFFLLQIK